MFCNLLHVLKVLHGTFFAPFATKHSYNKVKIPLNYSKNIILLYTAKMFQLTIEMPWENLLIRFSILVFLSFFFYFPNHKFSNCFMVLCTVTTLTLWLFPVFFCCTFFISMVRGGEEREWVRVGTRKSKRFFMLPMHVFQHLT